MVILHAVSCGTRYDDQVDLSPLLYGPWRALFDTAESCNDISIGKIYIIKITFGFAFCAAGSRERQHAYTRHIGL